MSDALADSARPGPIRLAGEPPFELGGLSVRPSTREAAFAGGQELLEPRVMQVLVALAGRAGEVVSRDELIERCWDGLAVGDDAINRCIGRLRRLAGAAGGAFAVETISRVGYRLTVLDEAPAPDRDPPAADAGPPVRMGRRRRWLAIGGAVLVVAVLVAAVAWVARPRSWTVVSSRPLVSTLMVERHPAISADGTMIAYSAGADILTRQIYLRRMSGGEPVRLSSEEGDAYQPVWSSDGARIAYAVYKAGLPCRIMVAPAPAGLARQVGSCRTEERTGLSWRPGSEQLFYTDRPAAGAPSRVMALDLDTGRSSAISQPPPGSDGDNEPRVSPDGRWLAFARRTTSRGGVAVLRDLKSGAERELKTGMDLNGVAWADDSKSLFQVVFDPGGGELILSQKLSGGRPQRVYATPQSMGRISNGPHGLLAAEINTTRFNLAETTDSEGSATPDLIDAAPQNTWGPTVRADGTVAMASDRAGDSGVWVLKPGSGARQVFGAGRIPVYGLAWSHDGGRLAFATLVANRPRIRVIRPDGGPVADFAVPGIDVGRVSWSADDRAVIFALREASGSRIWRADIASPGKPAPISGFGWIDVQAYGDQLYGVRAGMAGIWRLASQPVLVASPAFPAPQQLSPENPPQWVIAGDRMLFAEITAQNHFRLMQQPLDGGSARLAGWAPAFRSNGEIAFDPRTGRAVYVAIVSGDTDIELLQLARR
jgi:Tol biopolymer transport system component/DNA-binding winged helix-turn-helix (wHTH) protein